MQEHKIKIDINAQGAISAETLGFEGEACVDELAKLMAEIGELQSLKKKPEYYKKAQLNTTLKNQQGR